MVQKIIEKFCVVVLIVCKSLLMEVAPLGAFFVLVLGVVCLVVWTFLSIGVLLDWVSAPFGLAPGEVVEWGGGWLAWWFDKASEIGGDAAPLVLFGVPLAIVCGICSAALFLWNIGMALYEWRKEARLPVSSRLFEARRQLLEDVRGLCGLVGTAGGGFIGYGLGAYIRTYLELETKAVVFFPLILGALVGLLVGVAVGWSIEDSFVKRFRKSAS